MSDDELNELDSEFARRYPPLITFKEAAEIARRARATIYDWSTRNLLDDCKVIGHRSGLLYRKKFLRFLASMNA